MTPYEQEIARFGNWWEPGHPLYPLFVLRQRMVRRSNCGFSRDPQPEAF